MRILDITHLNRHAGMYAIFGSDGNLYIMQVGGSTILVAYLPGIGIEERIKLYVHEPWVCVTEHYGTHAALVHLENGSVREMSREDYYADVSSYSIGFLERNGRVLLICQTEWNRLNIIDAETGECLTERKSPDYEDNDYVDYFHSLLHVSPDGEYFLSNGWIWHPIGQILGFRTEDFLKTYESAKVSIDYRCEYNWDIPCTFIGKDRFVLVADNLRHSALMGREELEGYVYKPLQFYNLSVPAIDNRYGECLLTKEREASCNAFKTDQYGKVHGELSWDAKYGCFAAITEDGAFALSVEGEVLDSLPDCKGSEVCADTDPGMKQSNDTGWHYSPEHHVLYHWSQDAEMIEEYRFRF